MSTVFAVYGWDSMASSMGDQYLEGLYSTREGADARAKEMNDSAREHWMKTASPAGRANYRDQAHVVEYPVK